MFLQCNKIAVRTVCVDWLVSEIGVELVLGCVDVGVLIGWSGGK
jgi:hypothetical protein